MLRQRFALPLAGLLLLASGCGPKPGGSCDEKTRPNLCLDPRTRLHCEGGTWKAQACLGDKGCSGTDRDAQCDTSIANEKDACWNEGRYSCTPDRGTELRCRGGAWTAVARCSGKQAPACDASGFIVHCSGALVTEGAECEADKDKKRKSYGCSTDRKAELLCKDGRWTRVLQCLAPEGCDSGGMSVSCKGPAAGPGDLCDPGDKPEYACSLDGKAMIVCQGAPAWKVDRACLGPKGCTSSILGVDCDSSVSPPGAACGKEGNAACSTDGKSVLECKGGKYVVSQKCRKTCQVAGFLVHCEDG